MTDPLPFPPEISDRLVAGAFLLIDKPRGPSSHQATAWARDLLGVAHAGHAGTLDPNVSGLLWVGVGPALKLIPLVLEFPKRYIGVVTFHAPVLAPELERRLVEFTGPIFQLPPVRSAVKRERRIRTIHRLVRVEGDRHRAILDVTADSGTYVRTLAVDLGEALGVGGHLEELRRVGTGPFRESGSVTLTGLADAATEARDGAPARLRGLLHPLDEVWREFPVLRLKDAAASAIVHGANLAGGGILTVSRNFGKGAYVVLTSAAGELLGFGTSLYDAKELPSVRQGWVVEADRVLADPARFPPKWGSAKAPTAAVTPAPDKP